MGSHQCAKGSGVPPRDPSQALQKCRRNYKNSDPTNATSPWIEKTLINHHSARNSLEGHATWIADAKVPVRD